MKVLGFFALASGAITDVIHATWSVHDMRLFKELWPCLSPNDIVLGDRAFGSYLAMALLAQRGIDVVTRLFQRRRFQRRHAQRIGPGDWLVTWEKPKLKKGFIPTEWEGIPDRITVRIIRVRVMVPGFRTQEVWLSTTLLDRNVYPAEAIADLYRRRWEMEVCFRDLKTTMGMEELRCQTPAMVEKELLAYLIGHNFIRCLIAEAGHRHNVCRTRISVKGTLDTVRSFYPALGRARSSRQVRRLFCRMLEVLATDQVPHRPGRHEPRAVKRRPKNYQLLTKPRHIFKECPHRSRYRRKEGRP